MTHSSKQTPLDEALPGMVLADDLLDSQGHILLPQGTKLTEAIFVSMRRYDIETLPILTEELSVVEEAAEIERHLQRLPILFRKNCDDKASLLLQQYVSKFRMGAAT